VRTKSKLAALVQLKAANTALAQVAVGGPQQLYKVANKKRLLWQFQ
jgi:hypothetical protein